MLENQPWSAGVRAMLAQRAPYRSAWEQAGLWTDKTLYDRVEEGLGRAPHTRLIYWSETRPSETTLVKAYEDSKIVAAGLAARGVRAGDVIVVQAPHWSEGMLTWLAAFRLGIVVVPLVHIYGAAELGFVLRQTRAKALVTPARWRNVDYKGRLASVIGDAPDLEMVVAIGEGDLPGPVVRWDDLVAQGRAAGEAPAHRAHPDDVCTIIYTSGTTSIPKGALHTHNTLGAELICVHHWWENFEERAALASMPAGHIAGILIMMRPFILGGDSIHIDQWDPQVAVDLIHRYGICHTTGTPFHSNGLFDAAAARGVGKLADMMIGATNVPPSAVERGQELGVCIARAYGSTEHPTISTGKPYDPVEIRSTTDGRVMDEIQLRFVGDDGKEAPRGEPGEIVSMGPDLCVGYFDVSLNETAFAADGWFHTGDIGVLDANGMLTIVDRKKDIIIRGGENISSSEVEAILAQHPAVVEASALGWPDSVLGERVGVFLRLHPGASIDIPEIQRLFAAAGVARQKTPERIRFVDDLPRTASGKVKKAELRALLRLEQAKGAHDG